MDRRSRPDGLVALEAGAAAMSRTFWFDGGALLGKIPVGASALAERTTADGAHLIRVIDDHGRAAERDVQVQFAP